MSSRSWSEFRINFSQNTAWDLSREHWWDLINFESILFLYSLIVCLSKTLKYPVCPSKCILYIIFSIYLFWNCINLTYVSQLGNEDLVSDYIFTSQRESHSVPDMGFLLTFNYFVPFGVIENRFTKINFKYFNGNCWASLSFSYSLKITYILLRQVISLKKMVVLSVNFTILIFWSPVSFNPFISINEIGKYHNHNIV